MGVVRKVQQIQKLKVVRLKRFAVLKRRGRIPVLTEERKRTENSAK
jgi:hypothetical protein